MHVSPPAILRVEHIMGMPVLVEVRDSGADEAAVEEAFDWLRWVDATFSTFKADSEVSRIERGELAVADAHPEVQAVLVRCEELRAETGGFFDMRYGGSLDPSGLVKGWAVDRASALLSAYGLRSHAVSAGGDMMVRGGGWTVGIQHPLEPDKVAAVVEAEDIAVATSGAYERGEHVVDPHTKAVPEGLLSVTVTGPELGTADAYATAAFAMGRDALHWIARLPDGYEGLLILADHRVLSTPGFPVSAP
jgi:thiamine biosynthesis lipoprotein